jgi:hypothetical protein
MNRTRSEDEGYRIPETDMKYESIGNRVIADMGRWTLGATSVSAWNKKRNKKQMMMTSHAVNKRQCSAGSLCLGGLSMSQLWFQSTRNTESEIHCEDTIYVSSANLNSHTI